MARTKLQNPLGRDDAAHCGVLAEKMKRGDAEAARVLTLFYSKRKQMEIAKKYNPKSLVGPFLETANFLAGKAAKRD